jgi:hypothetical protein
LTSGGFSGKLVIGRIAKKGGILMPRKLFFITAALAFTASGAIALQVGDDHPAMVNYTINNVPPTYHGPLLNINSYHGKGVVVVHWKAS